MSNLPIFDTFSQLVAIDSPSLGERQLCDHLTGRLTALGLTVREDNAATLLGGSCGNLYGFLPGDEALTPLLFCAHMDTVEPSRGKQAILHPDGRITSAGDTVLGADDLAAVAAILEALAQIQAQNLPHRPIEVLFTVAEEIYAKGAGAFDCTTLRSRQVYVPDLTGTVGTAAYKAPTILRFTATITGRASHAGFAPQAGIHAIAAAAQGISNLPMGQIDEDTTCNIGIINGGLAPNIVPEHCTLTGEIRSYDHQKALACADRVEQTLSAACQALGAALTFTTTCDLMAYETNLNHPVVNRFRAVCAQKGLTPSFIPTFGGSDLNHFAQKGLTGLVLASAMNDCHSTDEYTSLSELTNLTNLILGLMTTRD